MALTESSMLNLGTKATDFFLLDVVTDQKRSLQKLQGSAGTLLVFICNHCPYVLHTIEQLVRIAEDYQPKGISTIMISSNDVEKYPVDSPDNMAAFAQHYHFSFPYLYDETQEVAKAYDAQCTPDIYLFDQEQRLYYRGRLDAQRPGSGQAPDGSDLRAAMEALLSAAEPPAKQYPSAGCNIKWKAS